MAPFSGNIFIADEENNRIRLIYSQIGPNRGHTIRCTNGLPCEIQLLGNGFTSGLSSPRSAPIAPGRRSWLIDSRHSQSIPVSKHLGARATTP